MIARVLVLSLALTACLPALAVTSRPTITGYEIVADPAIAHAVAPLQAELTKNVGKPFSRDIQMADVKRLQDLGTVANVKIGTRPFKHGTKLCYRVEANPKIQSIALEGLTTLDADEVLAEFATRPGQVLDHAKLFRDLNKIPALVLERKGVMYVDVLDHKDVKVTDGHVAVAVREFTMGDVVVRGVSGAEAELVRKAFKPKRGRPVVRAELLASLCDIYQLSIVKDLEWKPKFDREAGTVSIVLQVTPKEERHARAEEAGEAE
jgi:hypothetical protein